MKLIKFDLPIDGVKVKTVEELREHFTVEILDHFRSGLLTKWLASRKLQDEMEVIKALDGAEDHALLKGLCNVFSIEIDDEIASAMLGKSLAKTESNIHEKLKIYDDLAEAIDFAIYQGIRLNCITVGGGDLSKLEEVKWPKNKENYFKGESFFEKESGLIFCAPNSCELIEKIIGNEEKASPGDFAGWFMLPESAEDYSGNWALLSSILKYRAKLLSLISGRENIGMLKKSIDNRILKIEKSIKIIDGHAFEMQNFFAEKINSFGLELYILMRFPSQSILRYIKNGFEKQESMDSVDLEAFEKLSKVLSKKLDFFSSFSKEEYYRYLFFTKENKEINVKVDGPDDEGEARIELFVEIGDFVNTNDVIAVKGTGSSETPVFSPVTGFIKEIYVDEDTKISNGKKILKIEVC